MVTEQRLRMLLRHAQGGLVAVSLGRLLERQSERRRKARAALPERVGQIGEARQKGLGIAAQTASAVPLQEVVAGSLACIKRPDPLRAMHFACAS